MSGTQTLTQIQTWMVDPVHTLVEFSVKHMMITTVKGRFAEVEVEVSGVEGTADWTIEAKIDASSIDTRAEQRDAHLRSTDFFDVAAHPYLTFRSTRLEGGFEKPGDSFRIIGDLTIRGTSREVVLKATYDGAGKDPWGGERRSFEATTKIDRRDFGLTWNQGLEAGGVLVSNEVAIRLDVQLVKQS
jgi:polyisoprenoid-binding protein YceI